MGNIHQNQNFGDLNHTLPFGAQQPYANRMHPESPQKPYSWWKWAFGKKKIMQEQACELAALQQRVDMAEEQLRCSEQARFEQIAILYQWLTNTEAPANVNVEDIKLHIKNLCQQGRNQYDNEAAAILMQNFPDCQSIEDVKRKFDIESQMRAAAQTRVENAEREADAFRLELETAKGQLAAALQGAHSTSTPAAKPLGEEDRALLNKEIDRLRQTITVKNDEIAFRDRNIAELKSTVSELQAKVSQQEQSMRNDRQAEMSTVESDYVEKINSIKEGYQKQIDMLKNSNRVSIENLKKDHVKELEEVKVQYKDEVSAIEASKNRELQQLEARHIEEIKDKQAESDAALKRLAQATQQNIEKIKEDHYDEIRALNDQHRMLINKLESEVATANRESEGAAQALAEANKEKEQAVVGKQKALDQYAEAYSKLFFAAFGQIVAIKKAHKGDKATSILAKGIDEKIIDNYSYGLEEFVQACEKTIAEYKDRPDQLRGALRETFAECLRLDSANWMNVLARFYLYCKVPFIAEAFEKEGLQIDIVDRAFASLENMLAYCGIKISYPRLFVDEYSDSAYKLQSIRNIDLYVPNLAEHVRSGNTIIDLYLLGYDDGEQKRLPVVSKFA